MKQKTRAEIGPYRVLRTLEATKLWTERLVLYQSDAGLAELARLWMPSEGSVKDIAAATRALQPLIAVHHDNLERVVNVGRVEGALFVAQEYQPGRTANQLVQAHSTARGPLLASISIHIALEALRGLIHAHAQQGLGLYHGWLGPQVVHLTTKGKIKLRHLGLAAACRWRPAPKIAPSQSGFSAAADIRALTQMLEAMLLKVGPNRDPNEQTLPAPLRNIINRGLSTDPSKRFKSAQEMFSELEHVRSKSWDICSTADVAELLEEFFGAELDRELDEVIEQTRPRKAEMRATHSGGAGKAVPGPGTILAGRYRLVKQIGRGAAGVVFEAEHIELGTAVAVKMLSHKYSRDHRRVERFRREARAASKIGHPNIIRVTDLGRTDDDRFFYVMDLMSGSDLSQVIRQEGFIEPKRAHRILKQVCDALEAAHNMNVIHRDLKPENVVLSADPQGRELAQIVDFGLSLTLDSNEKRLTREGQAVGTPYYMAPEQVRGEPTDRRTDVYAAGAILYEMMTGVPLFEYETVAETLTAHLHDPPVPPRKRAPHNPIPEALEGVILKALEKRSENRYQSMKELSLAIDEAMSSPGISPFMPPDRSQSSSNEPLPSLSGEDDLIPPTRSRTPWIIAGVLAGVAVIALILVPWMTGLDSRSAARAAENQQSTTSPQDAAVDDPAATPQDGALTETSALNKIATAVDANPPRSNDAGSVKGSDPDSSRPQKTERPRHPIASTTDAGATPSAASGPSAAELTKSGYSALRSGNSGEAARLFKRALARSPGHAAAWAGLGQSSFERGQHAAAARALKRASDLRPGSVRYRLLYANALKRSGQGDGARRQYEEVLRLDPDNRVAKRMLGRD